MSIDPEQQKYPLLYLFGTKEGIKRLGFEKSEGFVKEQCQISSGNLSHSVGNTTKVLN